MLRTSLLRLSCSLPGDDDRHIWVHGCGGGAWVHEFMGAWVHGCSGMGVEVHGREGVQEKVESGRGESGGGGKDVRERIVN